MCFWPRLPRPLLPTAITPEPCQLALNDEVARVQLVKGLVLLNATPFWTVLNSRGRTASGTVPLAPALATAIDRRVLSRIASPANVRSLLAQVYTHEGAVDDALVARICASAGHPHAVDAFVSMMTAPRGATEFSEMVAAAVARGVPVCLIHGALASCRLARGLFVFSNKYMSTTAASLRVMVCCSMDLDNCARMTGIRRHRCFMRFHSSPCECRCAGPVGKEFLGAAARAARARGHLLQRQPRGPLSTPRGAAHRQRAPPRLARRHRARPFALRAVPMSSASPRVAPHLGAPHRAPPSVLLSDPVCE